MISATIDVLADTPIIQCTNSSFQYCSDTSRSTGGFLTLLQGAVVDASSAMPAIANNGLSRIMVLPSDPTSLFAILFFSQNHDSKKNWLKCMIQHLAAFMTGYLQLVEYSLDEPFGF
jgi:hypothetical protein